MEYRKIIDENGFVIDNCIIFINNIPQNFEMKDTYSSVTKRFDKEYIKPRWDGSKWIESATEEEIQAWQEENKIIKNTQPTEQEKLNAKLLQQNAEIQIQLEEQKAFNAQILLQLAGSDTNV